MHDLISVLESRRELAPLEVAFAASFLLDEAASLVLKADFLRALALKGETDVEIGAFVEAFLDRAIDPEIDPASLPGPAIDVCGTGGDRLDLFNVSTTSMFVLAAGGAAVVKHGNRSITSQCGGADVLEELGVRIDLPSSVFRHCLEELGCGFLFAPQYHPAFKAIAPVRKSLAAEGVASIFNLLGPLLNPARPAHQLVGVFSAKALPKYAGTLHRLGRTHAWAVHGTTASGAGMDEVSTMGPTHIHPVTASGVGESWTITLDMLAETGVGSASLEDLRGGDRHENARIVNGVLSGELRGPKRDIVVLNAGCAFVVAGLAQNIAAGTGLAGEMIDSGKALAKLQAMARWTALQRPH